MTTEPAAPPTPRVILHIDMDCFYVSVERLLDPSLEGIPVAVGGSADGRGVVASASYEARKYGVRSAMAMGMALKLCPHLRVVSGGYSQYSKYADQVHAILREFSPLVQMASQDEAYVDLTGTERLWGPPQVCAQRIRYRIVREVNLPCSIGLASSKLVSKVASDLCKPRGFLWVPPGSEESFLAPLPVGRLPGVGARTQERLAEFSITKIGHLCLHPEEHLESLFGTHGRDLAQRARGIGSSEVIPYAPPKSIGAEETFAEDSADLQTLEGLLSNLSEKVASRLRKTECLATGVTLKYRYDDFETHTAARSLADPTDDEVELLTFAKELLTKHWQRHRRIRLLGVTATGLLFGKRQSDLFREEELQKQERLHAAIDAIRDKHGYAAVRRATSTGRHEAKNDKQWG